MLSLITTEKHTFSRSENRDPKAVFGNERKEGIGVRRKQPNEETNNLHFTKPTLLFGRSNEGGWDGQGHEGHVGVGGSVSETNTKFYSQNLKLSVKFEDLDVLRDEIQS
jgi:hypothetical protein